MKFVSKLNQIKKSQILIDSFWSVLGSFFSKGGAFISGIFIANYIGKISYGEFSMLKATFLSLSILGSFGLGYTATKFFADKKNHDSLDLLDLTKKFSILTLLISISIFVLFIIFDEKLCLLFFKKIEIISNMKLIVLYVPLNALSILQIGILSGLGDFRYLSRINLITGLFLLVSSFCLTYCFLIKGALVAILISTLISIIFSHYRILKKIKANKYPFKSILSYSEIINYSLPVGIQEVIFSISSWVVIYLLLSFSTYSEVAMYNAALQWGAIALFLPAMLRNVVLKHMVSSSNHDHSQIMLKMIIASVSITSFFFCFVLIFGNLINSLYGSEYSFISSLIAIATLSSVFRSIINIYTQAYMSKSKNWQMLLLRSMKDLILFLILYFYVNHFEVTAAMFLKIILIITIFHLFVIHLHYKHYVSKEI